jgi:hypothetical protein
MLKITDGKDNGPERHDSLNIFKKRSLRVYIFIILAGGDSFPDAPFFDKQPFSQPNAIIAFFYTLAEKQVGSSNLKKQACHN